MFCFDASAPLVSEHKVSVDQFQSRRRRAEPCPARSRIPIGDDNSWKIEHVGANTDDAQVKMSMLANIHHDIPGIDVEIRVPVERQAIWHGLPRSSRLNIRICDGDMLEWLCARMAENSMAND